MILSCEICAELITATEEVKVTTCGHLFHSECVLQWFRLGQNQEDSCPHCRTPNVSQNLSRVYLTNSYGENDIHLQKNCAVVKLNEDLEELKIKLISMEEYSKNEKDKMTSENNELGVRLSSALTENDEKDKRIQEVNAKLSFMEKSVKMNTKDDEKQVEKEIFSLNLKLEEQEKQLNAAIEEIKHLKYIQELLINNDVSKKFRDSNRRFGSLSCRNKHNHGRYRSYREAAKAPIESSDNETIITDIKTD